MKIVKYIGIAFLSGAAFSIGAYFTIYLLFSALGGSEAPVFYSEYVDDVESKIGMPCLRVHAQAMEFAENDIDQIIKVGIAGEDWVASITPEQKELIDLNEEWLMDCSLARSAALEAGLEWPEFEQLRDLYSSLSIFSTSYGSEPASSSRLKPEAFESLQRQYREITAQ